MKVRATRGFSGTRIAMRQGETREISDRKIYEDLIKCGYAEAISTEETPAHAKEDDTAAGQSQTAGEKDDTAAGETEKAAEKTQTKKQRAKNENK